MILLLWIILVILPYSAVIFSSLPLWQVGLVQREASVSLAMLFYVAFPLNFVCISPTGKMEKKIMTLSVMSLDKEQVPFRPSMDRALASRHIIIFYSKRIGSRIFRCMWKADSQESSEVPPLLFLYKLERPWCLITLKNLPCNEELPLLDSSCLNDRSKPFHSC